MSGIAIIRHLLANAAGVTALIPAARIRPGDVPIRSAMPAIALNQTGLSERIAVNPGSPTLQTEALEIVVYARTYSDLTQIMLQVEAACAQRRGAVNGFEVDSIIPGSTGPDIPLDGENIYTRTKNYTVRFID